MQSKKRAVMVAGSMAALALTGAGLKAWAGENAAEEAKAALPVEQVIASIRTAVAQKPGRVLEVEGETERGKTLCEVLILGDDGKRYEVSVDVATNKAVEVELDNAAEDD